MNGFNRYRPLPEDRNNIHVCWRWTGDCWVRNDGLIVHRSHSTSGWELHRGDEIEILHHRTVGSMEDDDALGYIDLQYECPVPPPMTGQVWAGSGGEGDYAEFMIMGAMRQPGGFLQPIYLGGLKPHQQWPPKGMILVDGPGSPWQGPRPATKSEHVKKDEV